MRVVEPDEADALLDAIVALEERVYEPARRDSREKLALAAIPDMVRGTALTLALAGFLSLAFMGFAGLGG